MATAIAVYFIAKCCGVPYIEKVELIWGWDDQTQMLSENYIFSAFICLLQSVLHAKNIFLCRPGEISNRIEGYIYQMVFLKCVKGILVVISPDFAI